MFARDITTTLSSCGCQNIKIITKKQPVVMNCLWSDTKESNPQRYEKTRNKGWIIAHPCYP